MGRYDATTPSGCACHPSTRGELPWADTMQPPRQAPPATSPQEGNCLVQIRCNRPVRLRRRVQTRCDCSSVSVLVISPPQEGNCLVQIRCNHLVRLRRQVQTRCDCSSVSVLVISPPQEGNCLVGTVLFQQH